MPAGVRGNQYGGLIRIFHIVLRRPVDSFRARNNAQPVAVARRFDYNKLTTRDTGNVCQSHTTIPAIAIDAHNSRLSVGNNVAGVFVV